ncbi:MAG: hypothetical protein MZU97_09880 [Bacillus subtilis]|nr:hypothetical protein [Bacillus subtilis]
MTRYWWLVLAIGISCRHVQWIGSIRSDPIDIAILISLKDRSFYPLRLLVNQLEVYDAITNDAGTHDVVEVVEAFRSL